MSGDGAACGRVFGAKRSRWVLRRGGEGSGYGGRGVDRRTVLSVECRQRGLCLLGLMEG